jgi:FdhD protein
MIKISADYYPRPGYPLLNIETLKGMPSALRQSQSLFEQTGGIHAAGLFNDKGELLILREDVGRHNALDKLIGSAMQTGLLPLRDHLMLVSGRAGFELVQKCAMAGIPLVGFLRDDRFNVYCGVERLLNKI